MSPRQRHFPVLPRPAEQRAQDAAVSEESADPEQCSASRVLFLYRRLSEAAPTSLASVSEHLFVSFVSVSFSGITGHRGNEQSDRLRLRPAAAVAQDAASCEYVSVSRLIVDCDLSSVSVCNLYKELYKGCFPMLSTLHIQRPFSLPLQR